jgi:non-ribosomal peptide synthetase component F
LPDIASHDPYTDSLPTCFERIAAAHPKALAVSGSDWRPTFGELNVAANRVAHAILRSGAMPGDRVAILMEHDAPLVAGIIGALKAACIIVVLNTTDPPARLQQMTDDADPTVIIADATHSRIARDIAKVAKVAKVLCFEEIAHDGPAHDPALVISADQLAEIVYTSGSTGQPNGVMHIHGAAIAHAQKTARMMKVNRVDRLLFATSAGGGNGINTVIMGLLSGASLWPFPALDRGVHGLADYLTENAITVCTWSGSMFRHMMMTIGPDRQFPAVHCVRLSSERALLEDFRNFERHFSEHCLFVHSLASSETGQVAYSTLQAGDDIQGEVLPIGRLHAGVSIELLDEAGQPAPRGEAGELVVTSRSVTVGYWRNPRLTRERCQEAPDKRHRTLHTGDMVRWNEAGVLEFVERLQRRHKIRGVRIELSEVERALRGLAGVKAATCSVFDLPTREPQLVAFIARGQTAADGTGPEGATIRRHLRALLPRQMIPSTFVLVDELPLNANGKIDSGRLRAIYEARERDNSDRPQTATGRCSRAFGAASSRLMISAEGRTFSTLAEIH